ncbi:hypothetical protein G4B88_016079 [Cannabis sativa]|uniref:Uncharacterized protein n=1 Tax=Cannabis sativa TaxID=3483 RepID=A0A7J6EY32_CANSA|nr:hypothetical protein G4B88_016079 [Cannabis sativa]
MIASIMTKKNRVYQTRREKAAGIKPDVEIDAFMKATATDGQQTNLITDYVLKISQLRLFLLPNGLELQ